MVLNPSAKKIDPFVLDSAIKGYQRFVDTNEMPEAQESLDALKAFGRAFYPSANSVKSIYCIAKEKA